jgi:hypothetical protein
VISPAQGLLKHWKQKCQPCLDDTAGILTVQNHQSCLHLADSADLAPSLPRITDWLVTCP